MSFLTGSSPSTSTSNLPTTSANQSNALNFLINMIQSGGTQAGLAGGTQYPSTTVAPQTGQQTSIVNQLAALAGGLGTGAAGANTAGQVLNAEGGAVNAQAPQVSTPQTSYAPTAPIVSPAAATNAFQTGVVQPTTQNFLQTVMPSLSGQFGGSAGGAYSSGLPGATSQAVSNLNTNLAGQGAQYALNTQNANQQAQENTNSLLTSLAQSNLGAATSTNALNTGATLQNAANVNNAISDAASALGAPTDNASNITSILDALFPTVSSPQTTAEQGLTTQIGEIGSDISENEALDQLLLGAGTSATTQPQTVVQQGSTGLLGGLLSSLGTLGASSAGGGLTSPSIFASLLGLSDERTKTDIQQVGRLAKTKLPVYSFRYKADPSRTRRVGVMAQDVEKKLPSAVGKIGDFKAVNYPQLALYETFPEAA